jgi:acyl carrier protein
VSDILADCNAIFRDILDQPDLQITRQSSAKTVEGWDSLAHMNLVTAIQQHFKIRFALGELEELKDVGDMVDLIKTKLSAR